MPVSNHIQYRCNSGVQVRRLTSQLDYGTAIDQLADSLDESPGVLLASSFEFPGRYTRWDIGFVNPPLKITGKDRKLQIVALNVRGEILLPEVFRGLKNCAAIESLDAEQKSITVTVSADQEEFAEEMRSRKASLFSVLREVVACFASPNDPYLGLFGAFGYDLTFQFEDVVRHQTRGDDDRDLVLYLPDQITVADHRIEKTFCYSYEFVCRGWDSESFSETTGGFRRSGPRADYVPRLSVARDCDHEEGEYAQQVVKALDYFRRGDLFEVVPGQVFFEPCKDSPAQVFKRLKLSNPFTLWRAYESWRAGVSGSGFAGDVCQSGWRSDRDLSYIGHHQARRRSYRRCQSDQDATQFRQGRVRTFHVYRRRQKR